MMRTLLLTPWMAPHRVIPWERAVVLVILGKVDVLEEYDEEIRAPSWSLRTRPSAGVACPPGLA